MSKSAPAPGGVASKLALVVAIVVILSVTGLALVVRFGDGEGEHGPSADQNRTGPPPAGPGLTLHAPPPAPPVLAAAAAAPEISLPRLRRHLVPQLTRPGLGTHLAFTVAQLGRPALHWSYGAPTAMPASTLKLLTTAAALSALGPDHRFTTTVMRGSTRRTVVLVGGGDPLLAASTLNTPQAAGTYPQPASLEALAEATAAKLAASGVRRVRLGYDASLFSGPAVNPHWPATYVPDNVVSPVSALWVNEGRETPGLAQRSADPARAAAEAFRAQLIKAGVGVVGDVDEQRPSRTRAAPIAEVASAPLMQIVQHILEQSDNEGAEVLLRQVAVARGHPGSSVAGVTAVRATLAGLGVGLRGVRMYDGSGLSREDLVPVSTLLGVLEVAASTAHPELRGVLTGLPVAGFSGSLGDRFQDQGGDRLAADGRGYVRAKTGTLTGVHGLAGLAMTRNGQVLLFAAVADRVADPLALEAEADLDRIAAALTTCRC